MADYNGRKVRHRDAIPVSGQVHSSPESAPFEWPRRDDRPRAEGPLRAKTTRGHNRSDSIAAQFSAEAAVPGCRRLLRPHHIRYRRTAVM
jgi:hypothetical protein